MHQEPHLTRSLHTMLPPALLVVGSPQETTDYAVRYVQATLCKHGGCKSCPSCMAIAQHNHYQLLWITPEQRYTLDILEPITQTITLTLEDNDHFFFVLSNADTLSLACANSLLKIVEEPPTGYHFIFLAQRLDEILPTIRSRCIVALLDHQDSRIENHALFTFFTPENNNPALFLKALEQSKITEQECAQLFDDLLIYWNTVYKKSSGIQKQHAHSILMMLHQALELLPMPGSSKLFLKNLYLAIHFISSKKV